MVGPRFDSVPTDDVHARVHRRQSFWLHAVSFGCCLLPPLALLVLWDWHETGVIGPIAALSSISVHNRRAGHQAWMFDSQLIGPVGFMAKGDQRPPYYTPLYLPRLERSLRRDQPWPVDIVRNVRQDDVIVVLRPMLDEVLDALDARGAATPSFTLVSVNYDDAVTPQLRQRIGATRAIRRAFAQNLMTGPRDDKIHPLPLGFPTHQHVRTDVERLVRSARALRLNLTRRGALLLDLVRVRVRVRPYTLPTLALALTRRAATAHLHRDGAAARLRTAPNGRRIRSQNRRRRRSSSRHRPGCWRAAAGE